MKREEDIKKEMNEIKMSIESKREEISDEMVPGAYFYDVKEVEKLQNEIKELEAKYKELEAYPTKGKMKLEKEALEEELSKVNEELEVYEQGGIYQKTEEMKELEKQRQEIRDEISQKDTILKTIEEIEKTEKEIEDLKEEEKEYYGSYFIPDEITKSMKEKEEQLEKLNAVLEKYSKAMLESEHSDSISKTEPKTKTETETKTEAKTETEPKPQPNEETVIHVDAEENVITIWVKGEIGERVVTKNEHIEQFIKNGKEYKKDKTLRNEYGKKALKKADPAILAILMRIGNEDAIADYVESFKKDMPKLVTVAYRFSDSTVGVPMKTINNYKDYARKAQKSGVAQVFGLSRGPIAMLKRWSRANQASMLESEKMKEVRIAREEIEIKEHRERAKAEKAEKATKKAEKAARRAKKLEKAQFILFEEFGDEYEKKLQEYEDEKQKEKAEKRKEKAKAKETETKRGKIMKKMLGKEYENQVDEIEEAAKQSKQKLNVEHVDIDHSKANKKAEKNAGKGRQNEETQL